MGAAASAIARPAAAAAAGGDQPSDGPLSPFPAEVIDAVLDHLEWRDILAPMRVNSVFYKAIAWRVVNRARILERNGTLEIEAQHTEPRLFLPAHIVSRWVPSFVEQLDIYPHAVRSFQVKNGFSYEQHKSPELASISSRPNLPNFRTLRIFFGPVDGHNVFHTDLPPDEQDAFGCLQFPHRHPETITLRDVPARTLRNMTRLLPDDRDAPYGSQLRRQVHVIGPELVGEHGTVNGTIYLNWCPGYRHYAVESSEIVFWTPNGGEWLPIPPSREAEWSSGLLQRWFDRMLRTLQMSFIDMSEVKPRPDRMRRPTDAVHRLTIVNAGAISPACYASAADATQPGKWASYRAREDHVKATFNDIWKSTLPPTLAAKRAALQSRVHFVTFDEWVKAGRWRGVFDASEVGLDG